MGKFIKSFIFLFLITVLSNASVFAKNSFSNYRSVSLATPQPTGIYERYYCLNDVTVPLTATQSTGGTLNWYGTNATSGSRSSTAPIPSTATPGSITYYVSQTVGGIESTRSGIVVNVNKQLGLFCDASKTTPNSVGFDFANVGQTSFTFSYSISGGAPITGVWSAPSNYVVSGVSPGQSVTFTITAIGAPSCVTPFQTATCNSDCTASQQVAPTFTPIVPFCSGITPAPLLPAVSIEGITGTWSPAIINNTTSGVYTFTPNPILFPCALTKIVAVTVGPIEPDFSNFSICSGTTPPNLNPLSPNGIAGSWNPSMVDNLNSDSYVFTPNPGQPCMPKNKTITVTVNPSNAILNINWTVTDAFTKNQIVTVTDPIGVNYLYQMDDGPFQVSPIFQNVSSGNHSITVADVNGCSVLTNDNVFVINYPKYFTPNGDSYNDTWNIAGLNGQLYSRIYIFDRYGKLLKDISPKGSGWDGMYNGLPMPADDYWFSVEYIELDIYKKFKSHFSLKR